jgi:hypothetical protein
MALTTCRECSKSVAIEAGSCPNCGVSAPGEGGAERDAAKAEERGRFNLGCAGVLVALALLITVIIAKGGGGSADEAPTSYPVSRVELGADWPLTVDAGVLRCVGSPGGPAVTIDVGGTRYALNGTAKTHTDALDLRSIWAEDPELGHGLKKDASPLLDLGRALC